MAGVLSLGLGASGFDPLSHMDPFNGTYSVLLDHMDSSWDCSHAENPMEFSDNCNIDISEEFCFRGILFQSNFSIPCGLNSHLGFLGVHSNTSPCYKAAGEGEDQALPSKSTL